MHYYQLGIVNYLFQAKCGVALSQKEYDQTFGKLRKKEALFTYAGKLQENKEALEFLKQLVFFYCERKFHRSEV
jgi:hypothetical protein